VERETAADADLAAAVRSGNHKAFNRLAEAYGPRLYRAALHLAGDAGEAEEMAQEALVKGFLSAKQFRGEASFYTYLYRILINLWKNRLRTRSRWKWLRFGSGEREAGTIDIERFPAAGPDPHSAMEAREKTAWVRNGLLALNPGFRQILVLREAEGLDYREIATVLGIPVGTVRSRLARARSRLREILVRTRNTGAAGAGGD
jgi:RNA polymerase sigma-70 factor (ECF subfamily)